DSTFTNIGSTGKDTITSSISYNFYNALNNIDYYWKVRAIDLSGNTSVYSTKRKFRKL
ncbi:MAG: hypothetical protein JNL69_04275, partial [Bacteroidia bacterium]|nr:hypothetical protein [Bacteroidia bacterium]